MCLYGYFTYYTFPFLGFLAYLKSFRPIYSRSVYEMLLSIIRIKSEIHSPCKYLWNL